MRESHFSITFSHLYTKYKGHNTDTFVQGNYISNSKISILNNGDLNVDQKNNRDDDFCHNQAALLCVQNTLPAIHLPTTPLAM